MYLTLNKINFLVLYTFNKAISRIIELGHDYFCVCFVYHWHTCIESMFRTLGRGISGLKVKASCSQLFRAEFLSHTIHGISHLKLLLTSTFQMVK